MIDFFEKEERIVAARKRRVRVSLPLAKVKEAVEIAKQRNNKESKFGAMTYGGKLSGLKAHVIGMLAEIAVAHYFSQKVDSSIFDDHGDDGVDITNIPGYGVVGVKCTTYYDEPYMRVEKEHFSEDVDTYILCYVNPDLTKMEAYLIGWASKAEVAAAVQKKFPIGKSGRYGPMNYVLEEYELHGFL